MTFLAGNQGGATPAATGSVQANATDAVWHNAGKTVAPGGGTATAVFLNIANWSSGATGLKAAVYDSAGTLLGVSSTFTSADGTGLVSKSITLSRALVGGELVYIPVVSTGGYFELLQHSDLSTTVARCVAGSFPYASPPSTLPSPFGTATVSDWVVWIDGTTSGGSTAGRSRMMMGFG